MQKELIDKIKNRANVSDDTAKAAAEAVIGFLKDKLPANVAPMIDSAANGESLTKGVTDSIGGKLGKMFD